MSLIQEPDAGAVSPAPASNTKKRNLNYRAKGGSDLNLPEQKREGLLGDVRRSASPRKKLPSPGEGEGHRPGQRPIKRKKSSMKPCSAFSTSTGSGWSAQQAKEDSIDP